MRPETPGTGQGGAIPTGDGVNPSADGRDLVFRPLTVGPLILPNRLIRSATYEGMADPEGIPRVDALSRLYSALGRGGVGAIVTGFNTVSQEGRAMQTGQCGLDTDEKSKAWAQVLEATRKAAPGVPILAQLAHAGRQTRQEMTGQPVVGASSRSCSYFRERVWTLNDTGIRRIIRSFVAAALRARDAGFDGVQIHGAHGYLIHQFLSPWTNRRKDPWGERDRLCLEVVEEVRKACGTGFSVWVKLSGQEERKPGIRTRDTVRTARRLQEAGVDLLEISYGTMELALNIIRGECPLDEVFRVNPLFSALPRPLHPLGKVLARPMFVWRLKGFTPLYNLPTAAAVKAAVDVPVAVVGGVRSLAQAVRCLRDQSLDAVGLCRPLIREPDLPNLWRRGQSTESSCTNCNLCTVYCDSGEITKCREVAVPFVEGRST